MLIAGVDIVPLSDAHLSEMRMRIGMVSCDRCGGRHPRRPSTQEVHPRPGRAPALGAPRLRSGAAYVGASGPRDARHSLGGRRRL